jgi:threonine/homoserine efflux transporter RhtA
MGGSARVKRFDALARLPISLVAAIEFVGTIGVALYGMRTRRNFAALALAVAGVFFLIELRLSSDAVGLLWAGLNGALFVLYVVLGHRIAESGASAGVERLGAAMLIAFVAVLPIGLSQALTAYIRGSSCHRARERSTRILFDQGAQFLSARSLCPGLWMGCILSRSPVSILRPGKK